MNYMRTFLEFLNTRKTAVINEAFLEKDIDKAVEKINEILMKHINNLTALVGYATTSIGDDTFYSKQYIVIHSPENVDMFQLNWKRDVKTAEVYSIDFFDNIDLVCRGRAKAKLTINTLGSSIVYFLPIIWTLANSGDYNMSEKEAITLGRSVFKGSNVKESLYRVGALEYHVIENISKNVINDTFMLEAIDPEVKAFKRKKAAQKQSAYDDRAEIGMDAYKKIKDEYIEVRDAIAGGASTMKELKLAITRNQNVIQEIDRELEEKFNKEKEEHEDPEQVFRRMEQYLKMIIRGTVPSLIVCGAPGVGKTYRVTKQLKAAGYHEGHNLCTIKGKCSPRVLYTTLYNYQDKGDIVVIDDADSLVGPKAPEDCINILKGALDSTNTDEGRLITYGVAGKLLDDDGEPVPKRFYYRGNVIILTNWNAGSLDTALRGRSYIQDIHFTVEDVMLIIKKLMPDIEPAKLSMKAKIRAFDYLKELADDTSVDMEISMRTFVLCSQMYQSQERDSNCDDDLIRSMIKEQMKQQASRNKNKY